MNDEGFMQHAFTLAKKAELNGEVPVGCVIVKDNEIIAEGYNQPIQLNNPTAHAEIIAIQNAAQKLNNYRLTNTTLYVTLEPCAMCVGAMIHARIANLVFGAREPKTGAVDSCFRLIDDPRHNHFIKWQGGVMQEECSALLKTFFANRRNANKT